VRSASGFAALQKDWDALQPVAHSASVFSSWTWHYTWWNVYAEPNDELCILHITSSNKTVAILPLYIRGAKALRPRCLMFLGTGEKEADEVATEYLDIVAREQDSLPSMVAALHWIDAQLEVKRFLFTNVLANSVIASVLQPQINHWMIESRSVGYRYRMDLGTLGEEIPMNPKRHKRVKRSLRAIERDGGMKQTGVATADEIEKNLQLVAELSNQRQRHIGRHKSAFESDRFERFHQELLPKMYADGSVDIQTFSINDTCVATLFCFYDHEHCYYYQSGFATESGNRYMPLTVAHLKEIERNRAAGRRYYDFMRGEVVSYKSDFDCETTPMVTILCFTSAMDHRYESLRVATRRGLVKLLKRFGISRR